jgi:hypothetical protein
MTGTYKSAVFNNAIINAFGPAGTQASWKVHVNGAATPGVTSMLTTGNSGNGIVKTTDSTNANVTQTSGTGYTAGGYDPGTSTVALSGSTAQFIATGTSSWTGATFTALTAEFTTIPNFAGINTSTNPLLCYNDLSAATGTALSVVSGTLTLTWAGTGVMTIVISAEG